MFVPSGLIGAMQPSSGFNRDLSLQFTEKKSLLGTRHSSMHMSDQAEYLPAQQVHDRTRLGQLEHLQLGFAALPATIMIYLRFMLLEIHHLHTS